MAYFNDEDYKLFIEKAKIGYWSLDVVDGKVVRMYLNPIMESLLGVDKQLSPEQCWDYFTSRVHPDDFPLMADYLANMLYGEAEFTYRYIHKTNGLITVRCCGRKIKEHDNVITLSGYHKDIDKIIRIGNEEKFENILTKKNNSLLQNQIRIAEFSKKIINHASCGIVYYTLPNRDKLYMNDEALKIYNVKNIEEVSAYFQEIMSRAYYPNPEALKELIELRNKDGVVEYECIIKTGENKIHNLFSHTEVITSINGERQVFTTFLDVTENKTLKREKQILDTLCYDFISFFYLDFSKNQILVFKSNNKSNIIINENQTIGDLKTYDNNVKKCFEDYIDKKASPDFENVLNSDHIRQCLKYNQSFNYRFTTLPFNGKKHHIEVSIIKSNDDSAVMGYRSIDDILEQEEIKKEQLKEINERLEEQLNTIGGLSNAYFAVYKVNLQTNVCNAVKSIDFFENATVNNYTVTETANLFIKLCVKNEDQVKMKNFTDINNVINSLRKNDVIVEEFHGTISPYEWCRASWIVSSKDKNGRPINALFTVEDISSSVLERKKHEHEHKLLEAQNYVINGLSQEYTTVWLITDNGKSCVKYQDTFKDEISRESKYFANKVLDFSKAMSEYANHYVCKEDKEDFIKKVQYETILENIKKSSIYIVLYKRNYNGKKEYFQISFALADRSGIGNDIVMGFKNVDNVVLNEHRRNEELTAALVAAKQANEAKTHFLNNMSHDIRTPMNAILGFSNLMKNELKDEKLLGYQEKIDQSSRLLLSIINNILDMSSIESGKERLNEGCFDIYSEIAEICGVFEEEAKKKKIDFSNQVQVKHNYILCDATKIKEIFINLISNSIKYTSEGGKVTVNTTELPGDKKGFVKIKTEVSDNGIGISKEYLPKIFDPFSRERSTTDGKIPGTGLGMSIVKKLVDMMNGTIEVESEYEKGSKFTVIVQHKIADSKYYKKSNDIKSDTNNHINGKHILLVEDNDLNAEIAVAILARMELIVDRVEDGIQCVEKIKNCSDKTYDLILMDIQMPNLDGYKTTQLIRNLPDKEKSNIPIIAMTANAFDEDKKKAFSVGMNGHISKPIDMKLLKETLYNVLMKK